MLLPSLSSSILYGTMALVIKVFERSAFETIDIYVKQHKPNQQIGKRFCANQYWHQSKIIKMTIFFIEIDFT